MSARKQEQIAPVHAAAEAPVAKAKSRTRRKTTATPSNSGVSFSDDSNLGSSNSCHIFRLPDGVLAHIFTLVEDEVTRTLVLCSVCRRFAAVLRGFITENLSLAGDETWARMSGRRGGSEQEHGPSGAQLVSLIQRFRWISSLTLARCSGSTTMICAR